MQDGWVRSGDATATTTIVRCRVLEPTVEAYAVAGRYAVAHVLYAFDVNVGALGNDFDALHHVVAVEIGAVAEGRSRRGAACASCAVGGARWRVLEVKEHQTPRQLSNVNHLPDDTHDWW